MWTNKRACITSLIWNYKTVWLQTKFCSTKFNCLFTTSILNWTILSPNYRILISTSMLLILLIWVSPALSIPFSHYPIKIQIHSRGRGGSQPDPARSSHWNPFGISLIRSCLVSASTAFKCPLDHNGIPFMTTPDSYDRNKTLSGTTPGVPWHCTTQAMQRLPINLPVGEFSFGRAQSIAALLVNFSASTFSGHLWFHWDSSPILD